MITVEAEHHAETFESQTFFGDVLQLHDPSLKNPILEADQLSSSMNLFESMSTSDSEESEAAAVPCHLLPPHSIFRYNGASSHPAVVSSTQFDVERETSPPSATISGTVSTAIERVAPTSASARAPASAPKPLKLGVLESTKTEAGSGSSPVLEASVPAHLEVGGHVGSSGGATPLPRQPVGSASPGTAMLNSNPLQVSSKPISAGRTGSLPTGTSMDLVPLPDLKPKRIRKTGRRQRRPVPYEKMTEVEIETEKLDRLEKNRQSARDCRRRKKSYINSLEERLTAYEERETHAQSEILQLRNLSESLLAELRELKKCQGN